MSDDSVATVCGIFATREEAERAVEHLVQQYRINRADIFIRPQGHRNSAGTAASGGDAGESALQAALNGAIEVSADVGAHKIAEAEAALRETGAQEVVTY